MTDAVERQSVLDALPEIINGQGKRALYIGASKYRSFLLDDIISWGYEAEVLEIWPTNVAAIKETYGLKVVQGDVLCVDKLFQNPFDLVMWWHGPEHVPFYDFQKAIKAIKNIAKTIIIGCPLGDAPQETVYGNPFERHLWSIFPTDLESLGFSVKVIQRKNNQAHITAWHISS